MNTANFRIAYINIQIDYFLFVFQRFKDNVDNVKNNSGLMTS